MYSIDELKQLQRDGEYTLAIAKGDRLITSKARGVRPLVELIESGEDLTHGVAVDKVVGKAAALLYAYMGINELYAPVISAPAAAVCKAHCIALSYDTLAQNIINRNGDDICPMEKLTIDIDDPQTALNAIKQKLGMMHK